MGQPLRRGCNARVVKELKMPPPPPQCRKNILTACKDSPNKAEIQ